MKKAPVPSNEISRLNELYSYDILDSPPEQDFDDLVQLARTVTGVPTALISLVDRDRQWFKAKRGIEVTELPRDSSFCGHAICEDDVMLIPDASQDERFADNPLVTGGIGLRFYAGVPLKGMKGNHLGTICVVDYKPNELSASQIEALKILARQVVSLFELRKKNQQLIAINRILAEKQAEIVEAKKQTALAIMAGGLAHEINNPLAVIVSRLSILSRKLQRCEPDTAELVMPEVESMLNASQRISAIVRDMLDFDDAYRNEAPQFIKLSEVMRRVKHLTAERFNEHGTKMIWPEFEDFTFFAMRNQVVKLIVELLLNAFDAVHSSSQAWIKLEIEQEPGCFRLMVTDSGFGIKASVRDHMMEPFFTTKEPGRGSGLGLAVASQYAQANGGSLIYDETSEHTRFVISLPISEASTRIKAS